MEDSESWRSGLGYGRAQPWASPGRCSGDSHGQTYQSSHQGEAQTFFFVQINDAVLVVGRYRWRHIILCNSHRVEIVHILELCRQSVDHMPFYEWGGCVWICGSPSESLGGGIISSRWKSAFWYSPSCIIELVFEDFSQFQLRSFYIQSAQAGLGRSYYCSWMHGQISTVIFMRKR